MPRPFAGGEWDLNDLKKDPGETDNLGSVYPKKVQDMAALWEPYTEDNRVPNNPYDLSDAIE